MKRMPNFLRRFDAREKSMLSYATHYSNEAVFGSRAQMRVNLDRGKAILVVDHLQVWFIEFYSQDRHSSLNFDYTLQFTACVI